MITLSLQNLMDEVVREWPINEDIYPSLKGMKLGSRNLFATEHIQLHLIKTMGNLACALETRDHAGGATNEFQITRCISKAFTEIIRMAEVNGYDEKSLLTKGDLQDTMDFWQEKSAITNEVYPGLNGIHKDELKHRVIRLAYNRVQEALGDLARVLEIAYLTSGIAWLNIKQPVLNIFIAILRLADIHGYGALTLIEACHERLRMSKRKANDNS